MLSTRKSTSTYCQDGHKHHSRETKCSLRNSYRDSRESAYAFLHRLGRGIDRRRSFFKAPGSAHPLSSPREFIPREKFIRDTERIVKERKIRAIFVQRKSGRFKQQRSKSLQGGRYLWQAFFVIPFSNDVCFREKLEIK